MVPNARPASRQWTRGQLARALDCNAETIRYYESIKLLPAPKRTAGGYRIYGRPEMRRLRFLLRARQLGFTIEELRSLVSLVDEDDYTCGQVRTIAVEHLDDIRGKIADLRRLERTLSSIADQCTGASVPECPIIDALYDDTSLDD